MGRLKKINKAILVFYIDFFNVFDQNYYYVRFPTVGPCNAPLQ